MDVRCFTVGQVAENCYVLRRDGADRGLIVDPGEEAERILAAVDELGIGIDLDGRAQVSTNVHDPIAVTLATVIERVRELAAGYGARPVAGELVGLVPDGAIGGLPADVPIRGFDPDRHVLERRLGGLESDSAQIP